MNACIFTCQLISSPSFMSLFSGYFYTQTDFSAILGLNIIIIFLYGIQNLDFFRLAFPPLCLHPSITTLQVISLGYVVALYPLLLIFIFYALVKVHDWSGVAQLLCKPMTRLFTWFHKENVTRVSFIHRYSAHFSYFHMSRPSTLHSIR